MGTHKNYQLKDLNTELTIKYLLTDSIRRQNLNITHNMRELPVDGNTSTQRLFLHSYENQEYTISYQGI